jgi:hypothetical protein
MISYLYNLNLESINNMITEINRNFSPGATTASEEHPGHLLKSITVGNHTTNLVVDELDLRNADIWGFDLHLYNSATSNFSMYINNDKNATNYKRLTIASTNGAAVGAATGADAIISIENTANNVHSITGTISVLPNSKDVFVKFSGYAHAGETLYVGCMRYEMRTEHDNVFEISIDQSVTDAMLKDTHFRLWKITHSDTVIA